MRGRKQKNIERIFRTKKGLIKINLFLFYIYYVIILWEVVSMYQALYRKYRPNNFFDVTGQEIIIKTLKNAVENNKISHA